MSSYSKNIKFAKVLLNESLDTEGKVDKSKVVEILNELKIVSRSRTISILKIFLSLVSRKINTYEAKLNLAYADEDLIAKSIKNKHNDSNNSSIDIISTQDESLISGFRLRVGDDVYEDSILNRINRLKKSLS
jgi:F0F1-type ATP synthase delta subunit